MSYSQATAPSTSSTTTNQPSLARDENQTRLFNHRTLASKNRLKVKALLTSALIVCLCRTVPSQAQSLIKVPFPYSPINANSLPWMIAKDAKFFEKHGLDVDLVYFGASSLILQTMLSGSANYAGFAGPAIISNVLKAAMSSPWRR